MNDGQWTTISAAGGIGGLIVRTQGGLVDLFDGDVGFGGPPSTILVFGRGLDDLTVQSAELYADGAPGGLGFRGVAAEFASVRQGAAHSERGGFA